ncbi:Mur ligase family protein [Desertivibrio insolitus]|uniref:Mur ligase family protein n=1 Tax=Herbiconiux sp. SYSU D00978 TaxID=2812562 RepID=UPI001A96CCDD|nr:UDP-N-acetylmuramoyl-L-alanyl-D-glutamate--2,6-diaminopimelate ligase [Herbiconiux sp. SYSU D00978]
MHSRIPPVIRPEHPIARSLPGLVEEFGLTAEGPIDGLEVTGVTLTSGDVQPGDLYVGVPGAKHHGAQFAAQAAEAGAVAIVTDAQGREFARESGLPVIVVENPRAALGAISSWVYRTAEAEPKPTLFGVTGTNGKTSVAFLLEGMLRQLGLETGLSSTAGRRIGELEFASRLTTPEASELHALLARMRESEVRAVVLEVSAQALSRNRVDGIEFDVVGFTNLSHDHLDDYGDMETYFHAKLPLFDPERAGRGVVSLDSEWGDRVVENSRIPVTTVSTVPEREADWNVEVLDEQPTGTDFRLTGPESRSLTTRVPIIGRHMVANAAVAIVMLVEAGFELEAIGQALDEQGGIRAYLPGRTERVSGSRGPSVYVDFGHSADAFGRTLEAVRRFTPGRTIMVFGASGDRDKTKRFGMGKIAADLADVVIITDHHPRFEDPAVIRAALLEGVRASDNTPELHEVPNPDDAIRLAVSLADEGDTILWSGPGHLDYRDIQGVHEPFSAREVARTALQEAGWDE